MLPVIQFNKYQYFESFEKGAIKKMLREVISEEYFLKNEKYIIVSRGVHNVEGSETLPYLTYRVIDRLVDKRLVEYASKYADIHAYIYDGKIVYQTQYVSGGEMVVF